MIKRQAQAAFIFVALAMGGLPVAWAQTTPVGVWHSVDEKTGEASSELEIKEDAGVLTGVIKKVLRKNVAPDAVCGKCKDALKDHPLVGLPIITEVRKAEGKDVWEGGKILDPENGKTFNVRLTPAEAGKKLEVRGSFGPFSRTQIWQRVQ